MATLIQQIFSILVAPPGNLVYHLVLVFSIAGSLQAALMNRQQNSKAETRRLLTGLGILLGAQFILFILSGLGWQGIASPDLLLPPIDRTITALCLIWIIWMWGFPDPVRWADTSAIILSLLTLIALGITINSWSAAYTTGDFDALWLEKSWQAFSLALIIAGGAILLMRRPAGWSYGIGFLTLVLVGHLAQLLLPQIKGNFPGAVRLTQLAAFPLLLLLSQRQVRFSPPIASTKAGAAQVTSRPLSQERRRYSADPKTVYSLLNLALETDASKTGTAITRSISQVMLADLSLLISLPADANTVLIEGGYDLVREENLQSCSLEKDKIPLISASLSRGRGIRLPANHTSSVDLKTLSDLFSLTSSGNLLAVPLLGPDQAVIGGVVLLSPYSNRLWNTDDQAFLTNISDHISQILQRAHQPDQLEITRSELQQAIQTIEQLKLTISSLHTDGQSLPANDQGPTRSEGLAAETEIRYLENELRMALIEVAQLQNALAEANMLFLQTEKEAGSGSGLNKQQIDSILLSLKELQHSATIITGQADTLSKDFLNFTRSMHQKSLERINNEGKNIQSVIEGILKSINNSKSVHIAPTSPQVNIEAVTDRAISLTAMRMRDRNITLHVDLPDHLPPVSADREALQQVIVYLLQNASMATPPEDSINLKISKREDGMDKSSILVQVTDQGGGISDEDVRRMLAATDPATLPIIRGVGRPDEVAIANALTEAMGGKLWVECNPGLSSTFNLALPVETTPLYPEKMNSQN